MPEIALSWRNVPALKTKRRRPVYLDSAEQIAAMIEAAGTL
jgi:hypothetical protein